MCLGGWGACLARRRPGGPSLQMPTPQGGVTSPFGSTVAARLGRGRPQKKKLSKFGEQSHYVVENKGPAKRTKPNKANFDGVVASLSGFENSGCPFVPGVPAQAETGRQPGYSSATPAGSGVHWQFGWHGNNRKPQQNDVSATYT